MLDAIYTSSTHIYIYKCLPNNLTTDQIIRQHNSKRYNDKIYKYILLPLCGNNIYIYKFSCILK